MFGGVRRAIRRRNFTDFEKEVDELLRPVQYYAESHGGRIELVSASEDGKVIVKLTGSCAHCPVSPLTIKHGVKKALQEALPTFQSLEVVTN